MNYYNECDPKAAAWLCELIKGGLIPQGYVDERSILDVNPYELTQYKQHHFFAGIGGWSYALQLAGWPAEKPVITGSCPCQPFSAAGKQLGTKDERHLWPVFRDIVTHLEAATVFGEQVASKAGRDWLVGVRTDLEALGYAVGAADLCSAGVGSPNIRQRLYWVANADGRKSRNGELQSGGQHGQQQKDGGAARRLANSSNHGCAEHVGESGQRSNQSPPDSAERCGTSVGLGNSDEPRSQGRIERGDSSGQLSSGSAGMGSRAQGLEHAEGDRREQRRSEPSQRGTIGGCWDVFAVVNCADGKARRFEPGAQCLADGLSVELANRWDTSLRQIKEKIITYASSTKTRPCEALQSVREAIHPQFIQWCSRGFVGLQAEAVLFSALCELEGQLGSIIDRKAPSGAEALQAELREVRSDTQPSSPSPRRELPEQFTRELTDAMRELSQEMAPRIIHSYPLAHGVSGRVGLLRGYGNAINPVLAAEFIQAAIEAIK